ncbi:MAG TPA: hypothetical protein VI357_08885 [Mycobacteriales bacterium]
MTPTHPAGPAESGLPALAQAGATAGDPGRTAARAVRAGCADQAHPGRECLRLTGLTRAGSRGRCTCGHEHAASYRPFLAGARFVQDRAAGRS